MNREPKPATLLAATLAQEHFAAMSLRQQEHKRPYKAAIDAEAITRLGKRALRIAEQRCNGIQRYDTAARQMRATWTEGDESRAAKAAAKIESEAARILAAYGASDVKAQGDPRGFVLTFRLASGRSNSFASDVWGV